MAEWSDGPRLFEHFRDLEGPLRSADFPAYLHALGFPSDRLPLKIAQITPMRHRGVHVGIFYLAEKAGGEPFTDGDEEILVLFAAQAATAIANARTYRAEHRARAHLEALVETSPVGVVVFDVRTGDPVSLNREGRRIVKSLCAPGQSAEQLLGVITCRRADGREIALERISWRSRSPTRAAASRAGPRPGRGAHPGGRRRPGDAAPCPRHAGGGGLRPAGHRRPRPPAHRRPQPRNTQPTRATAVADQRVSQTVVCDRRARTPSGPRRRVSYPVSDSMSCRRRANEHGTETRADKPALTR